MFCQILQELWLLKCVSYYFVASPKQAHSEVICFTSMLYLVYSVFVVPEFLLKSLK